MATELTGVVADHITAVNAFDTDAIVATFADDAYVNDAHREIAGIAGCVSAHQSQDASQRTREPTSTVSTRSPSTVGRSQRGTRVTPRAYPRASGQLSRVV